MKSTQLRLAAVLIAVAVMLPLTASAAQGGALAVPVFGQVTLPNATTPVPLSGTLNITNFAVSNGQIVANGTLSFLLNGVQQIAQVALPVTSAGGNCPILSLTLGPLHLNVLGLVVDLNQINLNITAQSGPGNLLGNLLCDVANLLNGNGGLAGLTNGLLNQLANTLNQILGQL